MRFGRREFIAGAAALAATTACGVPTFTGPSAIQPEPVTAPEPAYPTILLAGDIAAPDIFFPGMPQYPVCELTAQILDANLGGIVITLGDNVYYNATKENYEKNYGLTWGRHKSRTRFCIGNHDAEPSMNAYYDYVGRNSSTGYPDGWYSFDYGNWHHVVLNTETRISLTDRQLRWLEDDLSKNTLPAMSYWHRPRYSTDDRGNATSWMDDARYVCCQYKVQASFHGHAHNFQLWKRMNAKGVSVKDGEYGMRQIITGTGGATRYGFSSNDDRIEVKNEYPLRSGDVWGITKVTLKPDRYEGTFVPITPQATVFACSWVDKIVV